MIPLIQTYLNIVRNLIFKNNNNQQYDVNELFLNACRKGDFDRVKYLLTSPELIVHADLNFQNNESLKIASKYGYNDIIEYLLTFSQLQKNAEIHMNGDHFLPGKDHIIAISEKTIIKKEHLLVIESMITDQFGSYKDKLNSYFFHCCGKGDLEVVRYLLTSSHLKKHVDIHFQNDRGLIEACSHNHLHIVKYLLASPELQEHANIHAQNGQSLYRACANNHLDIVKYLLTSPELKEHANIHADDDNALFWSCNSGHLEIVQYLLTSPDLKEHANIYNHYHKSLEYTYVNKHMHIVEYLIFDYQIEKTKEIEHWLISSCHTDVANMFDKRKYILDFKNKLQSDLPYNDDIYNTKNRIKI